MITCTVKGGNQNILQKPSWYSVRVQKLNPSIFLHSISRPLSGLRRSRYRRWWTTPRSRRSQPRKERRESRRETGREFRRSQWLVSGFGWEFLVANNNSSNYSSSSVSHSVILCDIIFILNIIWLDLIQYTFWNIFNMVGFNSVENSGKWQDFFNYIQLKDTSILFYSYSIHILFCYE